ncbi:MAG: hypothetical protein AAGJ86_00815 [Pseudomonadota bacterium]
MRALKRELLIAGVILLLTLIVVFPLTYVIGSKALGSYGEDGTLTMFVGSLFSELGEGNQAIWFFLLSPLLAISVTRVGWASFKRL